MKKSCNCTVWSIADMESGVISSILAVQSLFDIAVE